MFRSASDRMDRRAWMWILLPVLTATLTAARAGADDPPLLSTADVTKTAPIEPPIERARITLTITDAADPSRRLPTRLIVADESGAFHDGSGRGLYDDGRFFVDGAATLELPAGQVTLRAACGPNYVPLLFKFSAKRATHTHVRLAMRQWFSPEALGWYATEHHVHAQHDANAAVRTSLAYAALQARANGLSYMTEAGSNVPYDDLPRLSTDTFLLRVAHEQRPGPFVGHFNTPGMRAPFDANTLKELFNRPLPGQALREAVHARSGALIHTHPLIPAHQLHWMGATELLSDAVLGKTADAIDLDYDNTFQLYLAALNLGNRIAASASTDAALGRKRTRSPGDRRVYCQATQLDEPRIISALREGRTIATNGGPLFATLTVNGKGPGSVLLHQPAATYEARLTVHALRSMRSATLYQRGVPIKSWNVKGRSGKLELTHTFAVAPPLDHPVLGRVEDSEGNWVVTSPIYIQIASNRQTPAGVVLVFQISNASRFAELRPDFFAHLIATSHPHPIQRIELLRDEKPLAAYAPNDPRAEPPALTPVTGMPGDYTQAHVWHPSPEDPRHFQADFPVTESGRYRLRVTTADGAVHQSVPLHFRKNHPRAHQLSAALLKGEHTTLTLEGYGEELPLAELKPPYAGDRWWYPRDTYWRMRTNFSGHTTNLTGGNQAHAALFNEAESP